MHAGSDIGGVWSLPAVGVVERLRRKLSSANRRPAVQVVLRGTLRATQRGFLGLAL